MLSLAAIQGCGGDLALPSSSGDGVALSIVDGNGQRGTVGEELPRPLVVSPPRWGVGEIRTTERPDFAAWTAAINPPEVPP